MAKKTTVENILEKGMSIMFTKGYNDTGIQEVLQAADIPKGSFYYYFNSKEDFGIKVLEHYARRSEAMMLMHLRKKEMPPLQRLEGFYRELIRDLGQIAYRNGCMVGNCSLEMAEVNDNFQQVVMNSLAKTTTMLADLIREGQERGEISAEYDADKLGAFIMNSWEGALLRMKADRSVEPLELFVDHLFKHTFSRYRQ